MYSGVILFTLYQIAFHSETHLVSIVSHIPLLCYTTSLYSWNKQVLMCGVTYDWDYTSIQDTHTHSQYRNGWAFGHCGTAVGGWQDQTCSQPGRYILVSHKQVQPQTACLSTCLLLFASLLCCSSFSSSALSSSVFTVMSCLHGLQSI